MRARAPIVLLACLGVALVVAVSALSAAGHAPTFRSKLLNVSADDVSDAAIGDLNGDGRPDVVVANYNPSSVTVDLNRGDGHFDEHVYGVVGLARSVEIADLNGDQRPDLVAVTDLDDVVLAVLFNEGRGAFRNGPRYALAHDVGLGAVGDVNGDGEPDLVTLNAKSHRVAVWLNRGDGSFEAAPGEYRAGRGVHAVAVGDLNGDGQADLATANSDDDSVSVLLNHGDGTFEAKHDYAVGRFPVAIAISDLNGDGKLDLITANRGGKSVSVLSSSSEGSFARRDYRAGAGPFALAVGDLNGDGRSDLAALDGSVSVLLARRNGSFQDKLEYWPPLEVSPGVSSLAIADLNGDGRPDIAVPVINSRNTWTYVALLANTPGVCDVQRLRGMTVVEAKRNLARVNCRVGAVARSYSQRVAKGHVMSQKPMFGIVLPGGGKVNLVVSRGKRR